MKKTAKAIIETKYGKSRPEGHERTQINTTVFLADALFNERWAEIIKQCLPTRKDDCYSCTISDSLIVSTMDTKYDYSRHSYQSINVDLIGE